jgi:uncharacterized membrane protein YbaN (DUF454 family)
MLVAVPLEECDLIDEFGKACRAQRRRVLSMISRLVRSRPGRPPVRDPVLAGELRFPGPPNHSEGRILRYLLIALGMLNVALGVVGIFIPGMPTAVFLLIAGWFFARSSPGLHRWLHRHPRLGPYLEMARTRSMPLRARIFTIGAIWAGIGTSLVLRSDAGSWFMITLVAAGLTGTGFVLAMRRKPDAVRMQPAGPIVR